MSSKEDHMFKRSNGMLVVFLMFILVVLFLNACSEKSETEESADEINDSIASENDDEHKEPKRGGTYTIFSPTSPPTLDVFRASSIYTHTYAGLVYSKLLTYETGPDVDYTDYNIVPDLAKDWEVSDDGLVYTFYLRDTTWHDIPPVNGRKLLADDVVATMNHIMELPGHQASLLSEVESVEAPDDQTVVFTLKGPFAPFLNFLANHFMWILPKEAIEGDFDIDQAAIGTGPFMLEKYEDNVQAVFVRNPNYYEDGKPYLDEVVYKIVPDQGARIAAFRTGESDTISGLSPEERESLLKTNPDTMINEVMMATQSLIFMNMERKPFDDLRVRKAVSLAVDRQNAVDSIFGGGEIAGPVNPSLGDWALSLEEREALQPYDPEKAKELLAEAGYPDGFSTKIMTTDGYGEQVVRLVQWIVEDLKQIGIDAEIEMTEYAAYYTERWPNKDYDMGVGYQSYLQEADEWLTGQYHTDGAHNWFGTSDPKLDDMLEKQRKILDEEERKEEVLAIQRYILQEVINPIPLVTQYTWAGVPPYVKDRYPHASYGATYLKDIWLDK